MSLYCITIYTCTMCNMKTDYFIIAWSTHRRAKRKQEEDAKKLLAAKKLAEKEAAAVE